MGKLQEFYLLRKRDISGVSGIGIVARGIVLPSHRVIMEWSQPFETLTVYQNLGEVEKIHGHDGATSVIIGSPSKKLLEKKGKK